VGTLIELPGRIDIKAPLTAEPVMLNLFQHPFALL
jgi:hypothetical protein